jgi:hypothetical protein
VQPAGINEGAIKMQEDTQTDKPEKATEVAGQDERLVMLPMPENKHRVETGSIQFGDDWAGIFIRGDNAAFYANAINTLMMYDKSDHMALSALNGLYQLLRSCKQT